MSGPSVGSGLRDIATFLPGPVIRVLLFLRTRVLSWWNTIRVRGLAALTNDTKPVVTVLGCCRQDSIYSRYEVTGIREGLNYTHYPREAVEVVKTLSGESGWDPEIRFRNAQIGQVLASQEDLQRDFRRTDVFVVEAASRICYTDDKGRAYHHLIADDPKLRVRYPTVSVCELTTAEIESDLLQLSQLVAPRPMVLVSHVVTRDHGPRVQLKEEIREIARRMDVPFVEPLSGISLGERRSFVEDEVVISHLTRRGHAIAREQYREAIDAAFERYRQPEIIQTFPKPATETEFHGLGDFIQGAGTVLQLARKLKILGSVSLSGTALAEFLVNTRPLPEPMYRNPTRFYHGAPIPKLTTKSVVFTNQRLGQTWDSEISNATRRLCLTPRISFEEDLSRVRASLGVSEHCYRVLHLRFGDEHVSPTKVPFRWSQMIEAALAKLHEAPNGKFSQVIVMSDQPALATKLLLGSPVTVLPSNRRGRHIGLALTDPVVVRNVLVDFFLLARSCQILSLSVYPWVSGFAKSASDVFGVPLASEVLPQ